MSACTYRILLFAVLLASLGGCAQRVEWEEEVQLADGRVIRVERMQDWFRSSSVGESEHYSPRHSRLRMLDGRAADLATWRGDFEKPILLEYDVGEREYFLVVALETCGLWKKLGSQKPPYAEYRLRDGRWTRVSVRREHIGLPANLLISISRLGQPKDIAADDKRKANAAAGSAAHIPSWYMRIAEDAQIFGCH